MLGQLHPEGTAFSLRLTGLEFDAYEGASVHAFHDPAPEFGGSATIVDGGFEFEWSEPV